MSGQETVLVTGGSGFIGSWCVIRLLQKGYRVRTTVRSLARESAVRAAIGKEVDAEDRLSFHAAELTANAGWNAAAAGCDHMLHLASPVVIAEPTNPDDVVIPARDGTRRAVSAALAAGVKRVVLTSSVAAATPRGGGRVSLTDENDMDRSRRARGQRLFALQDRGRACRLGTRPHVERRHDARHGQSFRGARPGSQPGLFPVGRSSNACCPARCPVCRAWASASSTCATSPTCISPR